MKTPRGENKAVIPARKESDLVRVRMRPGRAAAGIGKPGEVVKTDRQTADRLVKIGYADNVEEESA